jgi:hypothetical protein
LCDLEGNEREVLREVIDCELEGIQDARTMTTEDPTIETPEKLLDLMSGLDDKAKTLVGIREKLC